MLSADWGNGTTTLRTFNETEQLQTLQHGPSANPGQFLNLEYDYNEGVANIRLRRATADRPPTG